MAHTFQLPLAVRFTFEAVEWHIATVRPTGWSVQVYGPDIPRVEVLQPESFRGFTCALDPREMPSEVRNLLPQVAEVDMIHALLRQGRSQERYFRAVERRLGQTIRRRLGNQHFQLLLCAPTKRAADFSKGLDPWLAREEFLRLKPDSPGSLLEFLNRYGGWNRITGPREERVVSAGIESSPALVNFDLFWKEQQALTARIRQGASEWFAHGWGMLGSDYGLESQAEFPYYVHHAQGLEQILETTVTLDFLRGTRFKVCRRTDCLVPFRLESNHKRDYCTQYCAHLASLRRRRKAAMREQQRRKHGAKH
jgi:hypothetical protein